MKRFINKILLLIITLLVISGQSVLAADYDLNTSAYNHLENWDAEFEISCYDSDVSDVIMKIAKKDDYLTRSLRGLAYKKVGNRATVWVTYLTTKKQEEYINNELSRIVNSTIRNNMSDFDKIKAINKYIIDRYEYDDSLVSNNVYSALTTGKTTCQGYAMTAYKMLSLVGIENKIVIGELDGVAHGWNMVKVNDEWYNLDVTNNDVTNNKYFLRNDKALRNDGFTWKADDYPICDKDYEEDSSNYDVTTNTQGISNNKQDLNNQCQPLIGYKSHLDGNWYNRNGLWYFLKNKGGNTTGWNIIDNQWYYFGNDGEMKTGWINYNGLWYYCNPINGAMVVNSIINGYRVDSTGAWIV